MILKIASLNIKNNKENSRGGIRENGVDNTNIISDFIKEQKYDFIGTQELTKKFINKLEVQLNKYKIHGNYRFGNGIFSILPYNESNMIITKSKVKKNDNLKLPWISTNIKGYKLGNFYKTVPRIATVVITEDNICMINTHLDYVFKDVQKKQLNYLYNYIKEMVNTCGVILTGDFNMEPHEEHFATFIKELELLNLKRVSINENTWYENGKSKILDHIFVPSTWKIKEAGVINDKLINEVTDHLGIYAEVVVEK